MSWKIYFFAISYVANYSCLYVHKHMYKAISCNCAHIWDDHITHFTYVSTYSILYSWTGYATWTWGICLMCTIKQDIFTSANFHKTFFTFLLDKSSQLTYQPILLYSGIGIHVSIIIKLIFTEAFGKLAKIFKCHFTVFTKPKGWSTFTCISHAYINIIIVFVWVLSIVGNTIPKVCKICYQYYYS